MMDNIIDGASRFRCDVFPRQKQLYQRLVHDGQHPKAMMISCADSRVIPELIAQCGPGELFVCRNAGNIVPPFSNGTGGVSSAIEYAVLALGVRDIVICGHTDCGAMNALLQPDSLEAMPNVKAWLRHSHAAFSVVTEAYPDAMGKAERAQALGQENVLTQLNHLRTHPCVAARLAKGELSLHGWYFELTTGTIMALDGALGRFVRVLDDERLPIAQPSAQRRVAAAAVVEAAE